MSKKKVLPYIAIAGIFSVAAGGIYAYMTSAEISDNQIKIGKVTTVIEEKYPNKESDVFQKEACIKNTGKNPCYVRMFLGISDSDALDFTYFGDKADGPWYPASHNPDKKNQIENQSSYIEYLNELNNGWVYIPMEYENQIASSYSSEQKKLLGGWFYYEPVLLPGETTENLINYVNTEFPENEEKPFEIILYQEAAQDKDHYGQEYDPADGPVWLQAWEEFLSIEQTKTSY